MERSGTHGLAMESLPFDPAEARNALNALPQTAAVFALYGADAKDEPYIGRTPNLRGRLERLLQPSAKHPRRLQLAGRVRRIAWRLTGSEFESLLTQFSLLEEIYGEKAIERMHLSAPAFIRYLGGNPYPRIVVTNRPSQREADWAYGPFASRAAAERFAEEALKLFLLRRCVDDLDPNPSHPGCVYSEMKMCLAPCYKGCTDERYGEEAAAVREFSGYAGESKLVLLRTERDKASENLEFESAAALHAQVAEGRRRARAGYRSWCSRMSRLRAVILQPPAVGPSAPSAPTEVSVFLYEHGKLRGPASFSTLGMRIQNERSGSSSLFAQPVAVEAVPENPGIREQGADQGAGIRVTRDTLEARMEAVSGGACGGPRAAFGDGKAGASGAAQAVVLPAGGAAGRRNLLPRRGRPLAAQSHAARRGADRGESDGRGPAGFCEKR